MTLLERDVARDSKKMTTWDIGRLKFFLKWDLTSDNAVTGESSREQRQKQTRNLAKICEFLCCSLILLHLAVSQNWKRLVLYG